MPAPAAVVRDPADLAAARRRDSRDGISIHPRSTQRVNDRSALTVRHLFCCDAADGPLTGTSFTLGIIHQAAEIQDIT
jgi:hypothetical protein